MATPVQHLRSVADRLEAEGDPDALIVQNGIAEIERLRRSVAAMQGHTFFCQDPEGVLRRWYPPAESN